MSLIRSTLAVSVSAAASRILGFVRDIMIAAALGAGPAADAFLVAYRIPNLVRRILTEGGMNAAFVPLYLRLRGETGADAAGRFAADTLAGLTVFLAALTGLVAVAAPALVLLLASGYADDPATLDTATQATRLAFPFVAFAGVAALLAALLNAERRFLAAALAPLAVNAVMIVGLLLLQDGGLNKDRTALALAGLVSLSGAANLVIVGFAARRLDLPWRLARPRLSAPVRRLARIAGPALLASGAAQFIILAGAEAASFLPSAVSWFYYAERVFQLPLGFVGAAAGLVLLPELAGAARADSELSARQSRALEGGLIFAMPAGLALLVLAEPIVSVLFERGAFTAQDTAGTAAMLTWLGLGLPLAAAGKILSQSFFARHDLRSVLLASLVGTGVTFSASLLLAPLWGAGAVGAGIALGFAAHTVYLGATLARRAWWRPDRRLLVRAARSLVAAAAMAASLAAAKSFAGPAFEGGGRGLASAALLAALCLGGMAIYAVLCLATGAVTRADLEAARRG